MHVLAIEKRWKYRKIPGPFGWPLLGSLVQIATMDLTFFLQHLEKKYGSISKVKSIEQGTLKQSPRTCTACLSPTTAYSPLIQ